MTLVINGPLPARRPMTFRPEETSGGIGARTSRSLSKRAAGNQRGPLVSRMAQLRLMNTRYSNWKHPVRLNEHVPPPFENMGLALSELGLEQFQNAVQSYWESISEANVARAGRTHAKWAIRRVVREFETEIREFNRDSTGKLVSPETIYQEGYLIRFLDTVLLRYQVAREHHELARRLVRLKLKKLWSVE